MSGAVIILLKKEERLREGAILAQTSTERGEDIGTWELSRKRATVAELEKWGSFSDQKKGGGGGLRDDVEAGTFFSVAKRLSTLKRS